MIPLPKYQPIETIAQTWEYIENRFIEDWGDRHFKMIELVRHIRSSELCERIFGSTSMDKLVVSIYNPMDYSKESLHIKFDLYLDRWEFWYMAMPYQEPEFVRTYEVDKGIEKFDKFIEMIKW